MLRFVYGIFPIRGESLGGGSPAQGSPPRPPSRTRGPGPRARTNTPARPSLGNLPRRSERGDHATARQADHRVLRPNLQYVVAVDEHSLCSSAASLPELSRQHCRFAGARRIGGPEGQGIARNTIVGRAVSTLLEHAGIVPAKRRDGELRTARGVIASNRS